MSQNTRLSDDWPWFPPYNGTPSAAAEVPLWENGRVYRATQAQMRRADGRGWLWYTDATHTAASKQSISADARTLFTVDGAGAATDTRFRDGLPVSVWASNTLQPQAAGESYSLRLQYKAQPAVSGAGEYITLQLDIGGTLATIYEETRPILKGSSVVSSFVYAIPVFCLETFFANGGQFYVTPSANITLWDKAIFILRTSQP